MFITEMADDLAYGLAVRRAQAERRRMEGESDLATDASYVTDFEGNII